MSSLSFHSDLRGGERRHRRITVASLALMRSGTTSQTRGKKKRRKASPEAASIPAAVMGLVCFASTTCARPKAPCKVGKIFHPVLRVLVVNVKDIIMLQYEL